MGAGVVGEDAVGEGIVGEEVVVVGEGVVGTVGTGVGSEGAVSQGVVGEDVVGEDSRRGRTFRLPEQQIYPPSPPERGSGGEKRRAPFLPPRVPRALMCEVRRRGGCLGGVRDGKVENMGAHAMGCTTRACVAARWM